MNHLESTSTTEPNRFLVSAPLLKTLASQEMALILYQNLMRRLLGNAILNLEWFGNSVFEMKTCIEAVPGLDRVIEDCIYYPMIESFITWFDYHEKYVFFDDNFHDVKISCIDDFVLKSDGSVSFERTAKNMLIGDKLNDVQKFRLACLNCFADDVKYLWPLVRNDSGIILSSRDIERNPMIRYWIRIMEGESPRFFGDDPDSFEDCLIVLRDMKWIPLEYFWNTFSEDEQTEAAISLLKIRETFLFKRVLLKLNNEQLRKALNEIDIARQLFYPLLGVMDNFCKFPSTVEKFMWEIWSKLKCFITADQFPGIIETLVKEMFIECKKFVGTFLWRLWTSAPDQFKHHVLNNMETVEDIFEALQEGSYDMNVLPYCDCDFRFFIAVLTELSFQSRNKLWLKFWRNLILCTMPKYLDHVMKLCLSNNDEITRFKETHMMDLDRIEDFCYLMVANGNLSRLDDFLNYCSSSVYYVACVKRQILASSIIQPVFLMENENQEIFFEIDKFIDSAFFEEEDAREYKRKLIGSSERIQEAYEKADKDQLGISWV